MSNQPERKEEQEVDLVPVFVWIGNGFKNLFKAIGDLFKGIGHFLILFLIFIKKNIILLGVLFLIGAGLGYYLREQSKKTFTAQIRVEPNFKSTGQLISNINYYNSLVDQNDYATLAEELGISESDATAFNSFEIDADYNDTELLEEYDELARRSDTIALENFTFEGFKNAKRDIDYQQYKVTITAVDRNVLRAHAPKAVAVSDNSMIKAARSAARETANFNVAQMEYQLRELDSLMTAIQASIEANDSNQNPSTNVYVSAQKDQATFKEIYDQKARLLYNLEEQREFKYDFENTINIVSFYVTKGTIEKNHYTVKFALVFLGLGLLIALIPIVVRYLNDYEKRSLSH